MATHSAHRTLGSLLIGAFLLAEPASAQAVSWVRINEIDANSIDHLLEFVELYRPGGASLEDHMLVFYNGGNDLAYHAIDLDGWDIPADGFFVLGDAGVGGVDYTPTEFVDNNNAIKNGPDAVALYFDTTGTLTSGDFLSSPVTTPPAGAVLLDAVVHETNDADDVELLAALTPGQPQVNEASTGAGNFNSNQRVVDGGTAFKTSFHVTAAPTPGSGAPGLGAVRINEVDAQQDDDLEFVELYLDGGGSLDGYRLAFYEPGTDTCYMAVDLDGLIVDSDGLFVIGHALEPEVDHIPVEFTSPKSILNGRGGIALYSDLASPTSIPATAFVGTPVDAPPADALLIDALVYDSGASDDLQLLAALTPGQPQMKENLTSFFKSFSLQRVPDGGLAFRSESYLSAIRTPGRPNAESLPMRISEFMPRGNGKEFFEIQGPKNRPLDGYMAVAYSVATGLGLKAWSLQDMVLDEYGYKALGDLKVPNVDHTGFGGFNVNHFPDNRGGLALWYLGTDSQALSSDFVGASPLTPPAGVVLCDAVVYDNDAVGDAALIAALTPGQPHVQTPDQASSVVSSQRKTVGGSAYDPDDFVPAAVYTPGCINLDPFLINEVDLETVDPLDAFVELVSEPGRRLHYHWLIAIDFTGDELLALWRFNSLDEVPDDGLYVLGQPNGGNDVNQTLSFSSLPGSSFSPVGALALLRDFSGELTTSDIKTHFEDYAKLHPDLVLVDAVTRIDPSDTPFEYPTGAPLGGEFLALDEGLHGQPDAHSLQRRPDGGEPLDATLTVVDRPTRGQPNTTPWVDEGHGLAGSLGTPALLGLGQLGDDLMVDLLLTGGPPLGSATLVIGLSQVLQPIKGGVLVPAPDVLISGLPLNGAGAFPLTSPWPVGLSGFSVTFQYWIVDPTGPAGLTASNAISGLTP